MYDKEMTENAVKLTAYAITSGIAVSLGAWGVGCLIRAGVNFMRKMKL